MSERIYPDISPDIPPDIRAIEAADLPRLLELNNAFAKETSLLTADLLAALVENADVALQIGRADAMLLAFHSTANYDNANFHWFSARFSDFVYVDRIVIAASARRRGLARRLYENLFLAARKAGFSSVVCEVNSVPPNPGSDAFHSQLDFLEVGKIWKSDGEKQVRYLSRALL